MNRGLLFLMAALCAVSMSAATRYIDSAATGANNGTSWANAWTNANSAINASPGDTVYISGGPTGSTRSYVLTSTYGEWQLAAGTSGNRITYQIGQDASNNGTAIFTRNASFGGTLGAWIFQVAYINVSGDAGDGLQHFRVTSAASGSGVIRGMVDTSGKTDVHISYVDCGSMATFANCNSSNRIEIDHCTVLVDGLLTDALSFGQFTGATWDDNSIHHCTLSVPYDTALDGWGSDCLQWNGIGYSIYTNTIRGYPLAGARGNHQDGQQSTGNGSYIKIYGNTFIDIANYAIFLEAVSGGYDHVRIYNNIGLQTFASSTQFIACGTSGGFSGTPPCVWNDIVIANNMSANFGTGGGISLNNVTGTSTTFTSCYLQNNLFVDSAGGIGLTGNATSTATNNVSVTNANAATTFVSYTRFSTANNYRLLAAASTLVAQGVDLSTFFTTDITGITRAAPWDIGAYKYVSGAFVPAYTQRNPAALGAGF